MSSQVTLRPNGTVTATNWTLVGAGSAHAATSDNNDGTYLYSVGSSAADLVLDFGTYALAGDQRCAGGRLVSRIDSTSHGFDFNLDTWLRPVTLGDQAASNYQGPLNGWTTYWNPWYVAEFTQATIDALRGAYRNNGQFGVTNGALSESYIDLDIRTRPTVSIVSPTTDQRLFPVRPTVTWNYDSKGDTVKSHRVKVFTNAVVTGGGFNADSSSAVWDSGVVAGAANSKQVGTDLAYGATYWFYVELSTDFLGADWFSTWVGVRFIINTPPTITAMGTSPTTPITTTNRPNITGTYNDVDGNAAYRFQVKVFSEAQYSAGGFSMDTSPNVWDSGEYNAGAIASGAAFSIQVGVGLSPNVNFKAAVRAYEDATAGRWGAWTLGSVFVITTAPGQSYDPPQSPEVLLVTTDQPLQRVVVTLQGRDNLLTRNQASADSGTVGMEPDANLTNANLVRDTTTQLQGGGAWKMTPTVNGTTTAMRSTRTSARGPFPVIAGKTYTGVGSSRSASTARSAQLLIRWFDVANALLSTTTGATTANNSSTFTAHTVSAAAPANAVWAEIVPQVVTPSEAHFWDNLGFAPGSATDFTRGGLALELGYLADSFNRADSASAVGTSDGPNGGAWSALTATWGISGNRAYMVTATDGTDGQVVLTSPYLSDGYVEADVSLSAVRAVAGLVFRAQDASNFLMVELAKQGAADTIYLYKRVAGTYTALANVATAGLVLGTTYKVRVEFYGGQIYVYVGGQLRLSYLMLAGELNQFGGGIAGATSYGKFGLRLYRHSTTGDDGATRFDSFAAGIAPTQRITLERSLDGGTTWAQVRTAVDMNLTPSQQGIVYDYEVPTGVLAKYRAITEASEAGAMVISPYSAIITQGVALVASGWWLKDAVSPSTLNMQILPAPPFDFRVVEPSETFNPLGRKQAVFVSDGTKGIEGTLNVWVKTKADYDKLVAILGNGRALLLTDPLGRAWWVKFADQDWSLLRAQPAPGETTTIRHLHALSLPFREVSAPAVV